VRERERNRELVRKAEGKAMAHLGILLLCIAFDSEPAHREYIPYVVPPSARVLAEEVGERGDADDVPQRAEEEEEGSVAAEGVVVSSK
jgi:hypothetical protein